MCQIKERFSVKLRSGSIHFFCMSMNVIKHDNSMVIILWGTIISKCLILEHLVQAYSVPINSFFYIWLLTLSMATVATVVFLRTKKIELFSLKEISIIHFCWFGCAVICLLSIGIFSLSNKLESHLLPAVLSIILGTGYLVHGISIGKNTHTLCGIGWWIGAAILATQGDSKGLATLAFLVILLTILPLIIEMRQQKTGFV